MRPFEYYGGRFSADDSQLQTGAGPYTGGTFMRGGMGDFTEDLATWSKNLKDVAAPWIPQKVAKDAGLLNSEIALNQARAARIASGGGKNKGGDNTALYIGLGVAAVAVLFLMKKR